MKHKIFFLSLLSVGATMVESLVHAESALSWEETLEKEKGEADEKLEAEKAKKEEEAKEQAQVYLSKKANSLAKKGEHIAKKAAETEGEYLLNNTYISESNGTAKLDVHGSLIAPSLIK